VGDAIVKSLRRTVPAVFCAAAVIVLCGCNQNGGSDAGTETQGASIAPSQQESASPQAQNLPPSPAGQESKAQLVSGSAPAASPEPGSAPLSRSLAAGNQADLNDLPSTLTGRASLTKDASSPVSVPTPPAEPDADAAVGPMTAPRGPAASPPQRDRAGPPRRSDMTTGTKSPLASISQSVGAQDKPAKPAQKPDQPGQKPDRPTLKPGQPAQKPDPSHALTPRGQQPPVATTGEPMIIAEPDILHLGEIPTNETGSGKVSLVNIGDEPRKILQCKKTCGCTAIDCPTGKVLEPGESVEVGIRLNGGTLPRTLNKTVRFLIEDQAPIVLKVVAETISLITIEPKELDPKLHPDGRLVLRATDGEPFTVKTAFPAAFGDELPSEPKVEQELFLNWEKWAELRHQRRLLFTLDHPKCRRVYGQIARSAIPPRDPRDPGTPPQVDRPRYNFDSLLNQGDYDKIVELIVQGEIKPDDVDRKGNTPLLKAAKAGAVKVMQALLDASADIGAIDNVGRTPLMYAAQCKNVQALQLLLDAGADFAKRDNLGSTALSWAAGFGDAASVKELLEAGSEVDVVSAMVGWTPIIWASLTGEAESIRLLIEAGAEIETADAIQGVTPLGHAVRTGKLENARVLIEAGAALEAKDYQANTPLLIAAESSGADPETVRLLVEAGADLSATNRAGRNALDLANTRTDPRGSEVAELLKTLMGQAGGETAEEAAGR